MVRHRWVDTVPHQWVDTVTLGTIRDTRCPSTGMGTTAATTLTTRTTMTTMVAVRTTARDAILTMADIATIAATHMVRECSTNTRPSEIGLWVLWACLSHIYIGFEEPKVVRSGLYPILRCVYHYSLYTLMALAVAGRLAGAAQILGSTAISDDCIVHICHLVTYLCHYTT